MYQPPISKQNTGLCLLEYPDNKSTCSGRSFLRGLGVLFLVICFLRAFTSAFMGPTLSEEEPYTVRTS
jgi:hypothetical protein